MLITSNCYWLHLAVILSGHLVVRTGQIGTVIRGLFVPQADCEDEQEDNLT